MSLRRSERRKTSSLERRRDMKEREVLTKPTTSPLKQKVLPALKDRAEVYLANAREPPLKLPAMTSRKRKLVDLQDGEHSEAPALYRQDLRSAQSISKTRAQGKNKAKDEGTPKEVREKRLRRYRDKAPQSFLEKLHRAQTQRYGTERTLT
jgi:hypothetical protein